MRRTNSSRVGGVSLFEAHLSTSAICFVAVSWQPYRSLNLCHRTLTGASTLTKRKNGRLSKASTTLLSHISLVTHRSLHLSVTNSSNESMSEKVCSSSVGRGPADGTWAFEADFSTAGVAALRARCMRLNWCSSTRYEAMDDLPAQMPGYGQTVASE